jgi:hypothetical protein
MQANGIRSDQVAQVRGICRPAPAQARRPLDPSNRRISVIVQYIFKNTDDDAGPPGENEKKAQSDKTSAAEKKPAAKE